MKIYKHELVDIEGMSRVGLISQNGRILEIYVNTDDAGKIPHFHLRNKDDWNEFHTCIRIDKAEYFLHGSKQDTLNSKEKKALQDFMCKPYSKRYVNEETGLVVNNWQHICDMWDDNNSDVIIDSKTIQPDYTEL